jgi:hypothetical protein
MQCCSGLDPEADLADFRAVSLTWSARHGGKVESCTTLKLPQSRLGAREHPTSNLERPTSNVGEERSPLNQEIVRIGSCESLATVEPEY